MCCLLFKMGDISLNPLAGLRLLCLFFHFTHSVNPSSFAGVALEYAMY